MKIEAIHDLARFLSIANDWHSLAARSTRATPFQLPEWGYTWWKSFGSGELRVFAGWQDGALVGLLPCFLHSWNDRRQITILGSGISDYLGVLVAPEHSTAFLDGVREHLMASKDWDVCDWQDLSDNDVLRCLKCSSELRLRQTEDTPCARRSLESSEDEFLLNLSSGLRRNVRRYAKHLGEVGAVDFGIACGAESDLVECILELHTREWNRRGASGMVEQTGSGPFLRAVANEFSKQNRFRLFYISLDQKPVACIYAIIHERVAYGYMSGFDPDYGQFSLGTLVIAHAMRCSISEGLRAWDFLRGTESYKFNWGAEAIPKWRLRIERQ